MQVLESTGLGCQSLDSVGLSLGEEPVLGAYWELNRDFASSLFILLRIGLQVKSFYWLDWHFKWGIRSSGFVAGFSKTKENAEGAEVAENSQRKARVPAVEKSHSCADEASRMNRAPGRFFGMTPHKGGLDFLVEAVLMTAVAARS
jgi:hypothetical protein